MKKLLFFSFTILTLLTFCGICFPQQIVTSKELSNSDVEKAVMSGALMPEERQGSLTPFKLIGVHQGGNRATVYFIFKIPGVQDEPLGTIRLVRLNSGQWFSPSNQVFLMK